MGYPLVLLEIDCGWSPERCQARLPSLPALVQQRAERYLAPASRRNLIATRSRLGQVLAVLGQDQEQVQVADNGRPYHRSQAVQFNLTHSHDRAVLALSRDPALQEGLGVDLEWTGRPIDVAAIGRRFFTEDEYGWIGSDRSRFFHVWTRKEAIIKTNGIGLRVALDSFDVMEPLVSDHITGRPLRLETELMEGGYTVSWAVGVPPSQVHRLRDRDPGWKDLLASFLAL